MTLIYLMYKELYVVNRG